MVADSQPVSSPRPEGLVLISGAVIALCITGDSLLYGVLPLEAENLGLSLPLVGILLSVNRIIRLVVNTPVGMLFERWGVRWPFVGSEVLGLIVTVSYGMGWGFFIFLLARLGWGVSWSGLRLGGYHAVWAGPGASRGRLMGLLGAVISIGAAAAVLMGGYLRDVYGYQAALFGMALVVALAIPLALVIRWPEHMLKPAQSERPPLRVWLQTLRTPDQWSVLLATFLQIATGAIFVATAAVFLTSRVSENQVAALGVGFGTITGMLIALRWLSDLVVGPLLGEVSDRMGQGFLALLLSIVSVAALLAALWTPGLLAVLYLAIVFLAGAGVTVALGAAATTSAAKSSRPQLFLGAYATAYDAGLALGPILGLTLVAANQLPTLYLMSALISLMAVAIFWWVGRRQP